MNKKSVKLVIDVERCKGCGLCIIACNRKILSLSKKMNKKGIHYVVCNDLDKCTSCTMCAIMCPDTAIEVFKEEKNT
ncbi:MAG: 4Fe-4S dicluster domain-containing protein [Candidatus Ancaeobacter aquaticus]|nr:4Fe-4S dicluster domain-containing protein [Candidatus Ancaeobacter aquaticus]